MEFSGWLPHPRPSSFESQVSVRRVGDTGLGREPGTGSGKAIPGGPVVVSPLALQPGLGYGRRRGPPVAQTLPTGACVPGGFRGPGWAGATRPGSALPGHAPAREVPVAPERQGSPEGGLRAALGRGRCTAWASERARRGGAEGARVREGGSAREREPPAREGWVGERRWREERAGNPGGRPCWRARAAGGRAERGGRRWDRGREGAGGARPGGGALGPGEDKSVLAGSEGGSEGGVKGGRGEGKGRSGGVEEGRGGGRGRGRGGGREGRREGGGVEG